MRVPCTKSSSLFLLQPLTGRLHKGHMKERFYPVIWMWESVLCYFRRWLFSKCHFTHSNKHWIAKRKSLMTKWAMTLWKCYLPSNLFETQTTQYSDCFVEYNKKYNVDAPSLETLRSGWMCFWTTWCSWRCPCSSQGGWTGWPLEVPSIPNYPMILRF